MTKIKLILESGGVEINSTSITGEASVLEDAFYTMTDVLNAAARPKDRNTSLAYQLGRMVKYGQEDIPQEKHFVEKNKDKVNEKKDSAKVDIMRGRYTDLKVNTSTSNHDTSKTINEPCNTNTSEDLLNDGVTSPATTEIKSENVINTTSVTIDPYKKILQKGKRALVAFKCPDCGELIIMIGEVGDDVKCRGCGNVLAVPEGLVFTVAQCPNCPNKTIFYSSDDVDMIHCRDCESPIDLKYIDKMGHKISL